MARPRRIDDGCRAGAARWAEARLDSANVYAWDDFLLAAIVLMTRKAFPHEVLDDLGDALADVAREEDGLREQTVTCSGFVHQAYRFAGDACGLSVPFVDPSGLGTSYESSPAATLDDFLGADQPKRAELLRSATLFELVAHDPDDAGPRDDERLPDLGRSAGGLAPDGVPRRAPADHRPRGGCLTPGRQPVGHAQRSVAQRRRRRPVTARRVVTHHRAANRWG